jgi:heptosyltransferase-2
MPAIVLCNGSYGHLAASKQWPWFADLSMALKDFYDATIIKLGYGNELADVPTDIDYVGKLPILESLKVLSQADLFVTPDTFLMHCGDALNVPMVCIWGGSVVSKNKPVNGKARIVKMNLPCQPCHESKADAYHACVRFQCLSEISANRVMAACREML